MIRKFSVAIVAAISLVLGLFVGATVPAHAADVTITVTKANSVTMSATVSVPASAETITVTIGDDFGMWDGAKVIFTPDSNRTKEVALRQQDDAWQATNAAGDIVASGEVHWLYVLFVMGTTYNDSVQTVTVPRQDGLVYQLSVDGAPPVPLAPGTTPVPCGKQLVTTVVELPGNYAYPQNYRNVHTVPCAPLVVTPLGVMFYTSGAKHFVGPLSQEGVAYTLKVGQRRPKPLTTTMWVPCGKRLVVAASAAEGFMLTTPYRAVRTFSC